MIKRWLFLLFGFIPVANATQQVVKLGDEKVIILSEQHGKGKAFVHLHQNETTALQAARAVIRTNGGSLLTLIHSGARNIVFHLHEKRYEFDPNRIFTHAGIEKTLADYSQYTPEAYRQVKKLADQIKVRLPHKKIIAVHNNESYSLHDYLPGHDLAHDAQLLNVNQQHFYRNFYLVTKQTDFVRLKELNFNSVWQAINATDDGSLSVFLSDSDYINVEAGYDQLAAQIEMLKYA